MALKILRSVTKPALVAIGLMVLGVITDPTHAQTRRGKPAIEPGTGSQIVQAQPAMGLDITRMNDAEKKRRVEGFLFYARGATLIGRYRDAVRFFDEAIRYNAELPEAYLGRGAALYGLADREGALADYTQAIALKSDYAQAYDKRGNLYFQLGQKPEAIADLKRAIELYTRDNKPAEAERLSGLVGLMSSSEK
jgi:tetratricopeptide (TPR) repeat protein